MKRIIFLLAVSVSVLIPNARAQSLKWAYTNDLPDSYTNSVPMVALSSLRDDAGGSAWLYSANNIIGLPGFGTPLNRIIWLNKFGRPVLTNDVSPAEGSSGVWLVRLTRTELTVQMSGFNVGLMQTTNILRKFTITRTGLTQKDTPLEANERVAGSVSVPIEANDKTGFFSWTSRLPAVPEFVIRRYSK